MAPRSLGGYGANTGRECVSESPAGLVPHGRVSELGSLGSLFVGVDVVDKRPDVVAMGESGLFLAHGEDLAEPGIVLHAVLEDELIEGLLLIGTADMVADPVADLAIGDGWRTTSTNCSGETPAAWSQRASKPRWR